jgi:hypothetical protein
MSRYNICKETLKINIEFAKKKNIPISIILFNNTCRFYTNITIEKNTKDLINEKFGKECVIYDNLIYDDILNYVQESEPHNGTNFLIPYQIMDSIKELDQNANIFFLSDGYNNEKLTDENITFLSSFKNRVTTLGIGSKHNYDDTLMSTMSKNNKTIEGESAAIIQQELLAQISENEISLDNWSNVEITIIGKKSNLKFGSMAKLCEITEDEYNQTGFEQNTTNSNLILDIGSSNNVMISKKNVVPPIDIIVKQIMNIFITDQSGSMDSFVELSSNNNSMTLLYNSDEEENNNSKSEQSEYVKYTINLPNMKSFQRIIFSAENFEFKGQIKWSDSSNNINTMILHDIKKYNPITDSIIDQAIYVANIIGNNINIATISNKNDNIGYFREINQICKKYNMFFDDILENKILTDFSLTEILFYNKKQGMNLFYSTMNKSEINMHELINAASAGGGHKLLAASATMSAVCNSTPSQGGSHHDYSHDFNQNLDISMCSICFDEVREYIFSCGHCYACKSCAEKVLDSDPKNKCSFCNKDITWIRKIKMTEDQRNKEHYYKCISENCYNIATVISKCNPVDDDDNGYHLTYCDKCFNHVKRDYKKVKKTRNCFCGCEIKVIAEKIFFS